MSDTASSAAYRQRKQSVAQATGGTWRDAGGHEADGTHAAKTNIALVWVAYAIMIACNAAFEVFSLGGTTSAEVSGEVFAWFTPAGYVFAIWSVIYIGLAAWLVSYSGEASHDEPMGAMRIGRTAVLFTVSCALNIAWLALWHFELFVPSIIVIAALLATIGLLYRRVHVESTRLIDRADLAVLRMALRSDGCRYRPCGNSFHGSRDLDSATCQHACARGGILCACRVHETRV